MLWLQPAAAEDPAIPRCGPRMAMAALLKSEFGEVKTAQGLSVDGTLTEVFAGPNGSFTIIKTSPVGMSCIVDTGIGWRSQNDMAQESTAPRHDIVHRAPVGRL